MKTYHGYRLYEPDAAGLVAASRCMVRVSNGESFAYDLPQCQYIRNHSPGGFEWGYGGSGPAQLALALVADCWGDQYAVPKVYQRVKRSVAKLPHDGWKMTFEELDRLIFAAVAQTGFVPEVIQEP